MMSTNSVTFTHKGWFGICPVHFANIGSPAPHINPRHWCLEPVMILSEVLFSTYFWLRTTLDPTFDPQWPLQVTGELEKPITLYAHAPNL